jgi:hypothetical protein
MTREDGDVNIVCSPYNKSKAQTKGIPMNAFSKWFSSQLTTSAEGFAWAARQVPSGRQNLAPPRPLGEWSAARHVYHLLSYEQAIALPAMRQWLGDPLVEPNDEEEDHAWDPNTRIEDLLPRFQTIRQEQIALLPRFTELDWERTCETVWDSVPLHWVVSKTYQHTAEHISDVLRIALFWEFAVGREGN